MTPHQKYLSEMKSRGIKPPYMTEPQLMEAWGIKKEEEYVPFIARKSSSVRKIDPTLDNHITDVGKTIKKR